MESEGNVDSMYNEGSRRLQDTFDTRRIADRLEQVTVHEAFTDEDRDWVHRSPMFFLATTDNDGWPDVSHKGGLPGFVRVTGPSTLTFPNYDGNGMYRSLGNILINPRVGLLFVDFDNPYRLRINGTASLHHDDPLLAEFPGAQLMVRVDVLRIFPNCPRYVHKMKIEKYSVYVPRRGHRPPVPDWKLEEVFRDALPKVGPAADDRIDVP
jgi:predicted pyridoxine 5'-phosphate oxidase superfamily flavin-nucleotide-binding protein